MEVRRTVRAGVLLSFALLLAGCGSPITISTDPQGGEVESVPAVEQPSSPVCRLLTDGDVRGAFGHPYRRDGPTTSTSGEEKSAGCSWEPEGEATYDTFPGLAVHHVTSTDGSRATENCDIWGRLAGPAGKVEGIGRKAVWNYHNVSSPPLSVLHVCTEDDLYVRVVLIGPGGDAEYRRYAETLGEIVAGRMPPT